MNSGSQLVLGVGARDVACKFNLFPETLQIIRRQVPKRTLIELGASSQFLKGMYPCSIFCISWRDFGFVEYQTPQILKHDSGCSETERCELEKLAAARQKFNAVLVYRYSALSHFGVYEVTLSLWKIPRQDPSQADNSELSAFTMFDGGHPESSRRVLNLKALDSALLKEFAPATLNP